MQKLVILKLEGNLEQQGLRATLEIGLENAPAEIEIFGKLPAFPDLATSLQRWQDNYRSLTMLTRIKPQEIIYGGSIKSQIHECYHAANLLGKALQTWLDSPEFRNINNTLREELNRDETIRLLIRTDNAQVQQLPWHLWNFFPKYPQAEFALSPVEYQTIKSKKIVTHTTKVRILAILGNSTGINIQKDRELLEKLPDAQTVFLVEPNRKELNNRLWEQWDILFFAGHSETENEMGRIYINQHDSLTIDELKYGLEKAISQGLQLAIFNSCDGLGLAKKLTSLHIPQMIVMREPVPDWVAQEFLKYFLVAFARGASLYLALRQAREMLQGCEDKFPNATWLPVICQNPRVIPPTWKELRGSQPQRHVWRILVASLLVAMVVMGGRYVGMLQRWELQAFDHLMQLRSHEKPDPRLLIVTIDEADLQYQTQKGMTRQGSLSDIALGKLLQKLDQYQPQTIGIDIYRDFAADPKQPDLVRRLQQDDRLYAVCKVAAPEDGEPDGTPPPPEVSAKRLSFSDFVADDHEVARRQLLQMRSPLTSPCTAELAFNLQLGLHYLAAKGITAQITSQNYLQIGNVIFEPLQEHSSGYQKLDASGYQVLLNYRALPSPQDIAEKVTLRDILSERIDPKLRENLKNRIVIIGVTASTTADYWHTPYSHNAPHNRKQVPGVFVQAQMLSHILSAVEDHRRLFWWWSTGWEALWVWGWSVVGGVMVSHIRQPLYLGLGVAATLSLLFSICLVIFQQAGWIPLVPPALAFILTAVVMQMRLKKFGSTASSDFIKSKNGK